MVDRPARPARLRVQTYASLCTVVRMPDERSMRDRKLAGEAYCRSFARVYPLETVCLRFFNVFGPRQDPGSQYAAVVPRFATRMLAGRPADPRRVGIAIALGGGKARIPGGAALPFPRPVRGSNHGSCRTAGDASPAG